MAPHQPSTAHVQAALYASEQLGLGARLLADVERTGTRNEAVIVVDRVGVLAELYALADVAYVGGGFGTAGLHSVAEPAALGVPVLFGPRHGNAREATELEQAGGGFAVTDAATLEQTLARLRADATLRQGAGAAAAAFVSARRGGAGANAALLLETMRGERG
jgi:3-deoxy-D-manno-octulosonic-acid transferase